MNQKKQPCYNVCIEVILLNLSTLKPYAIWKQDDWHYYILPHPSLRPFIAHYTITLAKDMDQSLSLSLVPDVSGCMIFSFFEHHMESVYWGSTTKLVHVGNDKTPFRLYVEFRPGGAYQLSGIGQAQLRDEKLPLADLFPQLHHEMEQLFFENDHFSTFLKGVDQLFLQQYQKQLYLHTPQIYLSGIMRNHHYAIESVLNQNYYSQRHLNRLFHDQFGTSIKTYLRIHRINALIEQMQTSDMPLSVLAHEAGYYDQSHFIHDFKAVCLVTPGQYVKQMSNFYNETFKFQDTIISDKK